MKKPSTWTSVNSQNDRVWAKGKKKNIANYRLLIEREKIAVHLMVSAGVCYGGKRQLYFVEEWSSTQCVRSSAKARSVIEMVSRNFRRLDKDDFLLIHKTHIRPQMEYCGRPGMVTPLEERYRVFGKGAKSSNKEWYIDSVSYLIRRDWCNWDWLHWKKEESGAT